MAGRTAIGGRRRRRRWVLAGWGSVAALIALPFLAMLVTAAGDDGNEVQGVECEDSCDAAGAATPGPAPAKQAPRLKAGRQEP